MSLETLKERFKTANNTVTGTDDFLFDDLSGVDADHGVNYPLVLMKPPVSREDKFGDGYEVFDVVFYTFILDEQFTVDEMAAKWDEVQKIARDIIEFVVKERQQFVQTDKIVRYERGHNMIGNDDTIAIRTMVQLRVHDATFCS